MALADYLPETSYIPTGKTGFTVRGLSTEDVGTILREHYHDIEKVVDETIKNKGQNNVFTDSSLDSLALVIATKIPVLAARLISIASDEPDQFENARRLPMPIQIQAMMETFRLSFEEVGGPKKWLEGLKPMLMKLLPKDAMESLKAQVKQRQKNKGLLQAQN